MLYGDTSLSFTQVQIGSGNAIPFLDEEDNVSVYLALWETGEMKPN